MHKPGKSTMMLAGKAVHAVPLITSRPFIKSPGPSDVVLIRGHEILMTPAGSFREGSVSVSLQKYGIFVTFVGARRFL